MALAGVSWLPVNFLLGHEHTELSANMDFCFCYECNYPLLLPRRLGYLTASRKFIKLSFYI